MLTNNDNCGTPAQNLAYESTSCFYANGRDLKNVTNVGIGGIGVFNGKFNDIAGLRNLNYADTSMDISLDAINRLLNFKVNISATPGNTLTLNPDGLYVPAGGGGGFAYTVVNVNTTPYTVVPITGVYVYLVDASGGSITMNFPTAIGNTALYTVKKVDNSANTVVLDPNGAQTLDGQATQTIRFQNTSVDIYSDNVNLYIR
jgi:hypothetical protein